MAQRWNSMEFHSSNLEPLALAADGCYRLLQVAFSLLKGLPLRVAGPAKASWFGVSTELLRPPEAWPFRSGDSLVGILGYQSGTSHGKWNYQVEWIVSWLYMTSLSILAEYSRPLVVNYPEPTGPPSQNMTLPKPRLTKSCSAPCYSAPGANLQTQKVHTEFSKKHVTICYPIIVT